MRLEPSESKSGIGKRRLVCMEECFCDSGERSLQGRLRDLSMDGAFLRTADPFPVGKQVRLKFRLEEKVLEVTGAVRHSELGYGMGIQFLEIPTGQRKILETYLSALLERLGNAAYSRARRAPRIEHRALVRVRGETMEGKRFSEDAETLDVSEIGARLLMPTKVVPGQLLALQVVSDSGGSWAQFRIVWQGKAGTPLEANVGLERILIDLWGIHNLTRE